MGDSKKLVLVVDDNNENRKVIGNILINNGFEVGIAKDGLKALDFIKKEEPALILLDIMMPGMDGYEVCRILKSEIKTKHIPIIFLTAKTNTEDIVKGFEAGGVDYIQKPFNSRELLARVKTHIEIKVLRGLLPICSSCKNIRNDEGYWSSIENYIENHTESLFSHGICPHCMEKIYGDKDWYKKSNNDSK
jgi:DNA-binding response OmpR family regulator